MKKHTENGAASHVAAARSASSPPPPVGGADALPSVGAPTPPADDNPVPVVARKGLRAYQAEVDVAEAAANELRSSTFFPQIVGTKLGTAQQVADAIDFAAQWNAQAKTGATWNKYTQKQSNLAWNYALAKIDRLRKTIQVAVASDPAIEKELPNFVKLLSVRQVVAAKGVATKRKIESGEIVVNKAAKLPRKATKTSTSATSAAVAPAAPVVTSVTPVANGGNGTNGAAH